MKKDIIVTFLSQFIILFTGLLVYKILFNVYGEDAFSLYSISKREISILFLILLLGLNISVTRFISAENGKNNNNEKYKILFSTLVVVYIISFIFLLIGILLKKEFSFVFFGNENHYKLIFAIFLMVFASVSNSILYSYFRGNIEMIKANLLQVYSLALIPLISFFFANNLDEYFLMIAVFILIANILIFMIILYPKQKLFVGAFAYIPKLLFFGVSRIPGNICLSAILALPAIIVVHQNNIKVAGDLSFGITILGLTGQLVAPIGQVFLPKISHLYNAGNSPLIIKYINYLILIALLVSIISTILFQLFADPILNLYFENVDVERVQIIKNIMWASLFYPIFVTLRSIIDGYYEIAYNSYTTFIALTSFIVTYLISNNIFITLNIALFVLSLLTIYLVLKIKKELKG